jgi:hypothetical protein
MPMLGLENADTRIWIFCRTLGTAWKLGVPTDGSSIVRVTSHWTASRCSRSSHASGKLEAGRASGSRISIISIAWVARLHCSDRKRRTSYPPALQSTRCCGCRLPQSTEIGDSSECASRVLHPAVGTIRTSKSGKWITVPCQMPTLASPGFHVGNASALLVGIARTGLWHAGNDKRAIVRERRGPGRF